VTLSWHIGELCTGILWGFVWVGRVKKFFILVLVLSLLFLVLILLVVFLVMRSFLSILVSSTV